MESVTINPSILGRLIDLQNSLQQAADNNKFVEFIENGLLFCPGVESIHLNCTNIFFASNKMHKKAQTRSAGLKNISLKTPFNEYGEIIFSINNEHDFLPYLPFLENFAAQLALHIENRSFKNQLENFEQNITEPAKEPIHTNRVSESFFKTIFEQAAIGVAVIESETGKFIRINQRYCDIIGYTINEISERKTFQEITHPDDLKADLDNMDLLLQGKIDQFNMEKRYFRKNGETIWVNLNVSPTWKPGEKPSHHIAMVEDITERKLAIQALQESEHNYYNLFEDAGVSIWIEDFTQLLPLVEELKAKKIQDYQAYLQNHPELVHQAISKIQVVDVNQASLRLYGAKNKRDLLDSLEKTFVPASFNIFIQELVAICEGKPYFRAEAPTQNLQGKLNYILLTIVFPTNPAAWNKVIVSMMDISEQKRIEDSLRKSEHRHHEVIETSADGFWIVSLSGELLEVNDAYIQMSGYSREELLNMRVSDLEVQESEAQVAAHMAKIIHSGNDVFQSKHRGKNGVIWPVEVSTTYSELDGGCFFVFLRDIFQRQSVEYLTELKQQLADIAYKESVKNIMTKALDQAEEISSSNIGFFHFVEHNQETISLQVWSTNTLKNMCHAEGAGAHYPISEAGVWVDCIHQRQPVIHNDYPSLSHKKGMPEGHAVLTRELTVPIMRNNKISGVIGVGNKPVKYTNRDVEIVRQIAHIAFDYVERKQADERIEYLAYYDVLTGLPNRTLLFDRINQAIAFSKRSKKNFALCFLDLDGFKPVNDRYGHDMGDKLLMEIADKLGVVIREGDSLSRLGGDEFVILLTRLSQPDDHQVILSRILQAVSSPIIIDSNKLYLTASIGVTFYPQDNNDADALLRHADQAMYKAKAMGKNRFYIHDFAHEQQIKEAQVILRQVKAGLAKNEFVLYYQPKVNIDNGEIIGFEALIRWNHPERGLLSPGLFLPYIENTEEEIILGKWVIESALTQLTKWQLEEVNIPISVNISAQQLQQSDLLDYLEKILIHYPESIPNRLEFEILETVAISDTSTVSEVMQRCSEYGIKFSLDDFGTGYSSLTYFHRLPIDILKIDQHFVRDMLDDPDDWKIVKGVINLAAQYNRPVIAEGVESMEIAALLRNMGNTLMQGYVISRPMPIKDVKEWISNWNNNGIWQSMRDINYDENIDALIQIAILSHWNWVKQVIDYVTTPTPSKLPQLSSLQCVFSHWYKGLGRHHYGTHSSYAFIGPKHEKVHQIAEELVNTHLKLDNGRKTKLIQRLISSRDELIAMLRLLST